jgi:hypothetical protein
MIKIAFDSKPSESEYKKSLRKKKAVGVQERLNDASATSPVDTRM